MKKTIEKTATPLVGSDKCGLRPPSAIIHPPSAILHSPSSILHPPSSLRRSGVALVIVLGMLVLVAVLVIAFLSSVATELKSAKSYASGSDARQLADSAVNIVISQIQDATTTPTLAWASQPGMIRTYDNTGAAVAAYKLYSSGLLQINSSSTPPINTFNPIANLSNEIPDTWAASTDVYTDLNKPVTVGSGASAKTHYPIIDAGAVATGQGVTTALSGGSAPIEGCYLNATPASVTTSPTQTNPIPMPVQWLYVLKDGSIHAIDPTTKKIAGTTLPDGTLNPIIGRVAYWTDDETCKVNVNTASEGTFWSPPWADGLGGTASYERNLNSSSPVSNEFQRYPGHPAMTSLSPIFPPLASELNADGTTKDSYKQRIYNIIPRVMGGGSKSGTVAVGGATAPLVPDNERLFASVDEFMFNLAPPAGTPPSRQVNNPSSTSLSQDDIEKTRFFLTANSRAPEVNLFNKPRVSLWPLQANTATISDPTNAPNRNAHDKLIAFCSTIGTTPYYFQRYNTFDQAKIRTGGANYDPSALQNPIPSSQSPSMDWSLIQRNKDIFSYLQSLIKSRIPGLGGSLAGAGGKYSTAVGDQILTEMMDFIRSEVNTFNSKPASPAPATNTPYYCYAPFSNGWVSGQGQVVPLVIQPPNAAYQTKGFGRFPTITQAALVFYRTDRLQYVPNPATANSSLKDYSGTLDGNHAADPITILDWNPAPATVTPLILNIPGLGSITPLDGSPFTDPSVPLNLPTMRAVLILQPFNPTPGMPPWSSNLRYRVKGLNALSVKMFVPPVPATAPPTTANFPLSFSNAVSNLVNAREGYYSTSSLIGLEHCAQYWGNNGSGWNVKTLGATFEGSSSEEQFYPFFSAPVALTSSTFDINGCDIVVEIYSGYSNPNQINSYDLVQTINMTIPSTSSGLPIPNVNYSLPVYRPPAVAPANPTAYDDKTLLSSNNVYTDYSARFSNDFDGVLPGPSGSLGINANAHHPMAFICGNLRGDTVRSVQARSKGPGQDFRLIAGSVNVPPSYFEGHGLTDTPSTDLLDYNTNTAAARYMHSLRMNPSTGNNDMFDGFLASNTYVTGMTKLFSDPVTGGYHTRLVEGAIYVEKRSSTTARPNDPPVAPQGMQGAYMDPASTLLGDWDNGVGVNIDGPYINKADEGGANLVSFGAGWYDGGSYKGGGNFLETGASYSPNRQISSAVAFGSLPSGIDPSDPTNSKPWQTLLFCKNPAAGLSHPGFGKPVNGTPPYTTPPDNAFLDLFTMPIVEPYAISDPFSTAGKVNMNYQIVPFTYLTRDTGVRAVLKSTNIMAINTGNGNNYKTSNPCDFPIPPAPDFRYTLNLDEKVGTLAGFEQRFTSGDVFRSASEICDIYLVPKYLVNTSTVASGNPTYSTMAAWWRGPSNKSTLGYKLTGDNVREQPYGHIYPRLTTKSNTYTVHVMAQSIKKLKSTPVDQFVDGKDVVTGEFRGSFIVERYLDPNSDSLVGADGKPTQHTVQQDENDPATMVGPYKFRIVSSKRFAP